MAVFQHYYTSFVNRETGNAGFQVRAMSPGIPADTQSLITRMIAYRIPPTCDEYAIESHPIALRYFYKSPDECIFLCSQSNGSDENGRPGNFFAHTLVMRPDMFTDVPPILYWRSSFWQKKVAPTLNQLSPLASFDAEPSFDMMDQIWDFLAQPGRREQFYRLMCAVVQVERTQRRIVIIDSIDNVALWITAVSCLLPPSYRPFLSFATYHHDPYQAQFMITGTTHDSSFHASSQEYISYFILNAQNNTMSEVEPSPYADFVIQAVDPDSFDSLMLPFLTDYIPRFPAPMGIGKQLDEMARYNHLLKTKPEGVLNAEDTSAISTALTYFERLHDAKAAFTSELLGELRDMSDIIYTAHKEQSDAMVEDVFNRLLVLLNEHKQPTNAYILDELKNFTNKILQGQEPEYAASKIMELRKQYKEEIFFNVFYNGGYLDWLSRMVERSSGAQIQRIWHYMGSYLKPDEQSRIILLHSLEVTGQLAERNNIQGAEQLLGSITYPMQYDNFAWLQLLVHARIPVSNWVLKRFYYSLVKTMPLEKRVPYRAIFPDETSLLVTYEVVEDVQRAGPQQGLPEIEQWANHARKQGMNPIQIVMDGLNELQRMCNAEQWASLAPAILSSRVIPKLPAAKESELVRIALSNLTMSNFRREDVAFYSRYRDNEQLDDRTKIVILGIFAMTSGELTPQTAWHIHQYLNKQALQVYELEIARFIHEFFQTNPTEESHRLMVAALFTWEPSKPRIFWTVYYQELEQLMSSLKGCEVATTIFSSWFRSHPSYFLKLPCVPQKFFLTLKAELDNMPRNITQDYLRMFLSTASKENWFPILQEYLAERKNMVFVAGQAVGQIAATQFRKLLKRPDTEMNQKLERERQEQELTEQLERLFEPGKVRSRHKRDLGQFYDISSRELFWTCYWRMFTTALQLLKPSEAFDLCSFWFNDAFEEFKQFPYLTQDFLIGLPDALKGAQRERDFRDSVRKIDHFYASNEQQAKKDSWYFLLKPYLVNSGKDV